MTTRRKSDTPKQEGDSSKFSADSPVVNPADDGLNRDRFSREIAHSLAQWTGHESLVVSLCGEWGAGKTTLKHFIAHHLGEDATVVEFNPWQWSGQDKLLEGLLWQLGGIFGRKDIADKHASWRKLGSDSR